MSLTHATEGRSRTLGRRLRKLVTGAVTGDPLASTGSELPIGIAASAAALLGLGGLLVRRAALKKAAPSVE